MYMELARQPSDRRVVVVVSLSVTVYVWSCRFGCFGYFLCVCWYLSSNESESYRLSMALALAVFFPTTVPIWNCISLLSTFFGLLFPLSKRRFFIHMDISMVCDLNWIYSVAGAFRYIMRRQSINVTLQPLLWETSGKLIKQPPLYHANEGKKKHWKEKENNKILHYSSRHWWSQCTSVKLLKGCNSIFVCGGKNWNSM